MADSHRAIAEQRPVWVTAAFAISVFSGVLAAFLLLMKKSACVPLFVVSLTGALVATLHGVLMGGTLSLFTPIEIALAVAGPIVFGLFMVWYARRRFGSSK